MKQRAHDELHVADVSVSTASLQQREIEVNGEYLLRGDDLSQRHRLLSDTAADVQHTIEFLAGFDPPQPDMPIESHQIVICSHERECALLG